MDTVDTLLNARWLVPVEPEGVVLERHGLALRDGHIVDLLPIGEARRRYRATDTLELDRHVVLPGLVNAHTHAAMTLLRGLADDLPLMTWLQRHIWPAEGRWVGEDFVRAGTELALLEMLCGGITCFNDMYFFPDVTADCARRAGLRARVGLIVIDFPSAWADDAEGYLSRGESLLGELAGDPLVGGVWAPHAPYTVQAAALERVRDLASARDLPIHMHVHETAAEVGQWQERHGERPLATLDRLGLVGPRLLAVHMTQLTRAEIEQVAAAGVHVLHCPESNLKLASGFCPVARLDAAGVNLALGTDGAASNNDLDLFGELRTAALLAKGVAGDAAALPAARALTLATLGGARALGLAHEIGSLVPGKAADLIAVDLDAPGTQPVHHPISHLVYATARHQVSDVWVAGRRLLAAGEPTTLDAPAILARAREWGERIGNPAG
ncbi:MAG: TRZ/ATZ family hydrolase [Candidatus Competibacterales bacterium]|nr:TRZ/ATZ family hydrolase [Candidatus Competibacterales bacterium]